MRRNSIFIAVLILAIGRIFAAPDVQTIIDGDWTKFSTLKHDKAKGLNIEISYPKGWKSLDVNMPNVVQRFASESGRETATIAVEALPVQPGVKITEDEMREFFTEETLKEMTPDGAKILVAKPIRIEGLPAGMSEYSVTSEKSGVTMKIHSISLMLIHENHIVSVIFSVSGVPNSQADISDRVTEFRPLFLAMANKISLPDRRK